MRSSGRSGASGGASGGAGGGDSGGAGGGERGRGAVGQLRGSTVHRRPQRPTSPDQSLLIPPDVSLQAYEERLHIIRGLESKELESMSSESLFAELVGEERRRRFVDAYLRGHSASHLAPTAESLDPTAESFVHPLKNFRQVEEEEKRRVDGPFVASQWVADPAIHVIGEFFGVPPPKHYPIVRIMTCGEFRCGGKEAMWVPPVVREQEERGLAGRAAYDGCSRVWDSLLTSVFVDLLNGRVRLTAQMPSWCEHAGEGPSVVALPVFQFDFGMYIYKEAWRRYVSAHGHGGEEGAEEWLEPPELPVEEVVEQLEGTTALSKQTSWPCVVLKDRAAFLRAEAQLSDPRHLALIDGTPLEVKRERLSGAALVTGQLRGGRLGAWAREAHRRLLREDPDYASHLSYRLLSHQEMQERRKKKNNRKEQIRTQLKEDFDPMVKDELRNELTKLNLDDIPHQSGLCEACEYWSEKERKRPAVQCQSFLGVAGGGLGKADWGRGLGKASFVGVRPAAECQDDQGRWHTMWQVVREQKPEAFKDNLRKRNKKRPTDRPFKDFLQVACAKDRKSEREGRAERDASRRLCANSECGEVHLLSPNSAAILAKFWTH